MMSGTRSRHEGKSWSQNGFIVVATLWLLAGLATLATVASIYIAQSAHAIAALDVATQWDMFGSAGVELAAYELSAPATARRPTHGGFGFHLTNSTVRVEYMSEAARINLNMAPRPMIAGLFQALGAEAEAADGYAERVVAWRRTPKQDGQDTEQALYGASGVSYVPRQGPFSSVDELWLVLGLPVALVERAMPFVTVYSGMAEINVLDAQPEVIAALPGMTPAKLDAFLKQRADLPPDNPEFVIGALGGKQPGATVSASDAYRIRIRITLADGRQRTPEAVIQIPAPGEKQAFRMLAWTDEIDPERAGRPKPMESR